MSKTFDPHPFIQKTDEKATFEWAWPSFSSKGSDFSSDPSLKELEEKMLKEVREKAFFIEKEAYMKGFEQGEKDGRELGLKRFEVITQQLENLLTEIQHQIRKVQQDYEKEILKLMLVIGKRIFRQAALAQEGLILRVLQEAFQYVSGRGEVLVRLHPADYQYLLTHQDRVPFSMEAREGIRFVKDPSLTRGGCVLETSFGEVDATYEAQFEEMMALLLQQKEKTETDLGS